MILSNGHQYRYARNVSEIQSPATYRWTVITVAVKRLAISSASWRRDVEVDEIEEIGKQQVAVFFEERNRAKSVRRMHRLVRGSRYWLAKKLIRVRSTGRGGTGEKPKSHTSARNGIRSRRAERHILVLPLAGLADRLPVKILRNRVFRFARCARSTQPAPNPPFPLQT